MNSLLKKNRAEITKKQVSDFGMVLILANALLALYTHNFIYVKLACIFCFLNIVLPVIFYPLALCWFTFSKFLGKISSTILLIIIFLLIVIPVALIRKMYGADHLQLNQFRRDTKSVMVDREHEFNDADLLHSF